MNQVAKIHIKMGSIDIEYEGDSAFIKDDLIELLGQISSLQPKVAASIEDRKSTTTIQAFPEVSTNTLAAHAGGDSAPELAMTAAAKLSLIDQKATFSRKELLSEMQTATTYYKDTMSGNLSSIIDRLLKNKSLNQIKDGMYALSSSERAKFEAAIANIG